MLKSEVSHRITVSAQHCKEPTISVNAPAVTVGAYKESNEVCKVSPMISVLCHEPDVGA
jgi:hypothetical protein